jgi:hypothetical protein
MLMCEKKFGNRWEMLAKVEILPSEDGKDHPHNDAGLIFGSVGGANGYGIFPAPAAKELVWWEGARMPWVGQAPVEGSPLVKIRMWDGATDVSFDDKSFVKNRRTLPSAQSTAASIGIGTSGGRAGKKFKVSEWKIRKLDEQTRDRNRIQNTP